MLEIEAKFRVDDHEAVQRRLQELSARYIGKYVENNHILDRPDGFLRHAGCGLRVRMMETLQGQPASATLTYKGPRQNSPLKSREEIELRVSDAEQMLALLHAIGFDTVISYRKRRDRWALGGCHVELDKVPLIGTFVEIEGPSENAIRAVQEPLKLGQTSYESRSYVHMLAEQCQELGRSTMGIDFD